MRKLFMLLGLAVGMILLLTVGTAVASALDFPPEPAPEPAPPPFIGETECATVSVIRDNLSIVIRGGGLLSQSPSAGLPPTAV